MRLPRLLDEFSIGRADGRYMKLLKQLARIGVLLIDDWGLAVLDDAHRRDLLELLDDRHGSRSTIVTSQLPIEHWHAAIGDGIMVADALLSPRRLSTTPERVCLLSLGRRHLITCRVEGSPLAQQLLTIDTFR
ncbi:ATP-binding protein [Janthinobacterium sp. ROICE36]|uniref:ATP-binding protein n=1 Tax=Janthinobacterium sp. ROICE36 TaxID=2048670 RepID=UPI0035B52913